MDKYKSFHQLQRNEREGIDYKVHFRFGESGIAVIAPHGGVVEPGTTEIVDAVAGTEHAFYSFEGTKATKNSDLHITSEKFDEPKGIEIVKGADRVLAVHGCAGDEKVVYLGGLDEIFKKAIKKTLSKAGFAVQEPPRIGLKGRSPKNICNRGRSGRGVQLEITTSLRRAMFESLKRKGRERTTPLFHQFVKALRESCTNR